MFPSLILGFSGGKYKPFFRDCKVEIAKLWFRLASLSFASLCQNGIPDRWQGRYFGAMASYFWKNAAISIGQLWFCLSTSVFACKYKYCFLFSVVSAGIYLKKGFFCQFEMFAPERANRDGEGEKSLCWWAVNPHSGRYEGFVPKKWRLYPGEVKALSGGKWRFAPHKVTCFPVLYAFLCIYLQETYRL